MSASCSMRPFYCPVAYTHSVQKCTGQMCFSQESLATILWNGLVSIWALMVSLARWEMTARQHRGGLARADITNGERRYLKDRNHSAFEVFKCKQSLFNQLNQHQAPSTYKVYCTIWIWLLFCEAFAETSSSSWRAREPRVAGGSSQIPQPPLALKSFKSMWDRETDWAAGGGLSANKKMPSNFLLPQIC